MDRQRQGRIFGKPPGIRIHANPEKPPTNTRLMVGRPSRPLDPARSPARHAKSRATGVHFNPRTHPIHEAELRPRADRDLAACVPAASAKNAKVHGADPVAKIAASMAEFG